MYLARYVHRDVSTGNIILVTDANGGVRGKLSDVEYAKRFDADRTSGDPKAVCLILAS